MMLTWSRARVRICDGPVVATQSQNSFSSAKTNTACSTPLGGRMFLAPGTAYEWPVGRYKVHGPAQKVKLLMAVLMDDTVSQVHHIKITLAGDRCHIQRTGTLSSLNETVLSG